MLRTSNRMKNTSGSAGSNNEAHSLCKRRATADFVQNESIWIQNLKIQGFNFLDVLKIDGFPPEANPSLLASKFPAPQTLP